MSVAIKRLGLIVVLASSPIAAGLAQSTDDDPATKTGGVQGKRHGAIRSLGAAGYNSRGSEKAPAVVIPPLDEGPSGTRGVPLGTTVGPRIR